MKEVDPENPPFRAAEEDWIQVSIQKLPPKSSEEDRTEERMAFKIREVIPPSSSTTPEMITCWIPPEVFQVFLGETPEQKKEQIKKLDIYDLNSIIAIMENPWWHTHVPWDCLDLSYFQHRGHLYNRIPRSFSGYSPSLCFTRYQICLHHSWVISRGQQAYLRTDTQEIPLKRKPELNGVSQPIYQLTDDNFLKMDQFVRRLLGYDLHTCLKVPREDLRKTFTGITWQETNFALPRS